MARELWHSGKVGEVQIGIMVNWYSCWL